MITEDLLIIGGEYKIYIIDTNIYKLVRKIETSYSNIIGFCMLNENMLLQEIIME